MVETAADAVPCEKEENSEVNPVLLEGLRKIVQGKRALSQDPNTAVVILDDDSRFVHVCVTQPTPT